MDITVLIPQRPPLVRLVLAAIFFLASTTIDANAFSTVRDAETESIIREYTTPIFEAAGLVPKAVNIYLVDDKSLNAFVAGGQNIFIHTGLLLNANSYTDVVGVLAHETGHIVGGHLARTRDAMSDAQTLGLLTTIVGVGAGILTGSGELAAAAASGGAHVATRDFLSFSRAQESAADQAALRLLDATGTSARGLAEFLSVLQDQELVSERHQDPYVRTHPLSRERIDTIEAHLTRSKFSDAPPDPALEQRHRRVRAKVFAYTYPLRTVLNEYPETDQSLEARYARAFAYYRKPNFDKAQASIDALIADYPEDPYFHELKGQIYFEHGKAAEAVASYRKALEYAPDTALLRVILAQALIALEDPTVLPEAEELLEVSLLAEPRSGFAWRQLAIAYGRQDKLGQSALALGEEALIRGRYEDAQFHAKKALGMFPEGSKEWIQAQDIDAAAQQKRSR
ncbi:MAG: M48 family metalloprotease [Rhodospirillales bacterium]